MAISSFIESSCQRTETLRIVESFGISRLIGAIVNGQRILRIFSIGFAPIEKIDSARSILDQQAPGGLHVRPIFRPARYVFQLLISVAERFFYPFRPFPKIHCAIAM
ncbi:hypothetical protein HUU40_00225 [candidate division KSB1 bacterium]|nr:hypothetical protein [candidate division KSB1 bacterium]